MEIITIYEMTKAIENKIGMDTEEAEKIAHLILDTFGYESRIIDNILTPNERQIFYMLQSEGFLTTSRERSRLHDGREWMTHYWKLQRKTIYICAHNGHVHTIQKPVKKEKILKKKESVYTQLTDDMWTMRKILKGDSVSNLS
jgi:hypothetical protein